ESRRRAVLAKLARRRHSAGLVAYDGTEPIGFISLGPRLDFSRIANSKATPPVDDVDAWVIPCITVRRGYRGRGAAIAMIQAAVDHAARHGAAAAEAYPRAQSSTPCRQRPAATVPIMNELRELLVLRRTELKARRRHKR